MKKLVSHIFYVSLICILLLLSFVNAFREHLKTRSNNHASNKINNIKENFASREPELLFEITVHGLLLWASIGFLMPAGILVIRMSHKEECGKRLKILFYVHSISQMLSVLLCTAGAAMSIRNFNNSFNNHHQRIGIGLYGMVWLQALIGFIRPRRACIGRSIWLFVHWIYGTSVSLLGIINIYTGLQAYHEKTSRNIQLWTILYTVEVSSIVLFYLFQDKWVYIRRQGLTLGNED